MGRHVLWVRWWIWGSVQAVLNSCVGHLLTGEEAKLKLEQHFPGTYLESTWNKCDHAHWIEIVLSSLYGSTTVDCLCRRNHYKNNQFNRVHCCGSLPASIRLARPAWGPTWTAEWPCQRTCSGTGSPSARGPFQSRLFQTTWPAASSGSVVSGPWWWWWWL